MGFSGALANVKKIDSHPRSEADKAEIRRLVLEAIGAGAKVFDGFAGEGVMHDRAWHKAAGYVGCDTRLMMDDRVAFVADNRRVLRAIDLGQFNVFDLDAYGSPWEQVLIVAARRKVKVGETIGLVITEGSGLFLLQGGIPASLRIAAGVSGKMAGVSRSGDDMIDAAIVGVARRMNCEIKRRWQAKGHTGARMRYIGLVLEGQTIAA